MSVSSFALGAMECRDAREAARILADDNWLASVKIDGKRAIASVRNGIVEVRSRQGLHLQGVPMDIVAALGDLPDGTVLDGELCQRKYWVFDAISVPNLVSDQTPLQDRLRVARRLVELWGPDSARIAFLPHAEGRAAKEHLLQAVIDGNGEGLVLKDRTSRYVRRRSDVWRKLKRWHELDAIIIGLRIDGKSNAAIALRAGMAIVPVGRVSTLGKGPVKMWDVVTVKYLYAWESEAEGLVLIQPELLRTRDDKSPESCGIDQLRFTNLSIAEELYGTR